MLLRRDAAGQRTALVIDEAQSLARRHVRGAAAALELRDLHAQAAADRAGRSARAPGAAAAAEPPPAPAARQRARHHQSARCAPRCEAYILHRLKQVGGDERLFEPAALRAIVRRTRGHPAPREHPVPQRAAVRVRPEPAAGDGERGRRGHRRDGRAPARDARARNAAAHVAGRAPVVAVPARARDGRRGGRSSRGGAMLLGGRDRRGSGGPARPPGEPPPRRRPVAAARRCRAVAEPSTRRPEPAVDGRPADASVQVGRAPAAPASQGGGAGAAPGRRTPCGIVSIPPGGSILAAARDALWQLPARTTRTTLLERDSPTQSRASRRQSREGRSDGEVPCSRPSRPKATGNPPNERVFRIPEPSHLHTAGGQRPGSAGGRPRARRSPRRRPASPFAAWRRARSPPPTPRCASG